MLIKEENGCRGILRLPKRQFVHYIQKGVAKRFSPAFPVFKMPAFFTQKNTCGVPTGKD